jgi:hypothetical protein
MRGARPSDLVQNSCRRCCLASHAYGKAENQQRLDVVAVVAEELAAELLRLPMMAAFQPLQCDMQPRQPFRAIHYPLSCALLR